MKIKSFYIKNNIQIAKPSNVILVNKETNMMDEKEFNFHETEKSQKNFKI